MIRLVPADPDWPLQAEALGRRLTGLLPGIEARVEHIGSTAVPGLESRPEIDLCVVVPAPDELAAREILERAGLGTDGRESLLDALPCRLWLSTPGDADHRARLRLRDRLRADPDLARRYLRLKHRLARIHPEDPAAYMAGKTRFLRCAAREGTFPPPR